MSLFFRELSNKLVSWPFIIASNKNLLFLKIFRAKTIVDRKAKPEVSHNINNGKLVISFINETKTPIAAEAIVSN